MHKNKIYEKNSDYIDDIFGDEEDRLFDKIDQNISEDLRYDFRRLMALKDFKEQIKTYN